MNVPTYLVPAISAVFGAGAAWGVSIAKNHRTRRDLNGLGAKLKCIEAQLHSRYLTLALVTMILVRTAAAGELEHIAEMLHDHHGS